MRNFGTILKELRQAANLTQKELAEKANTTQAAIGRYETNEREPTWEAVQKIAQALGVSCEVFADLPPKEPQEKEEEKPKKKPRKA